MAAGSPRCWAGTVATSCSPGAGALLTWTRWESLHCCQGVLGPPALRRAKIAIQDYLSPLRALKQEVQG